MNSEDASVSNDDSRWNKHLKSIEIDCSDIQKHSIQLHILAILKLFAVFKLCRFNELFKFNEFFEFNDFFEFNELFKVHELSQFSEFIELNDSYAENMQFSCSWINMTDDKSQEKMRWSFLLHE